MNHIIVFLLGMFVAFLIWLIATQKIPLPILLETGLAAIAVGLFVCADSLAMSESYSPRGAALVAAGLAISLASMHRQYRKHIRALRHGEPHMIDGGSFRRQ